MDLASYVLSKKYTDSVASNLVVEGEHKEVPLKDCMNGKFINTKKEKWFDFEKGVWGSTAEGSVLEDTINVRYGTKSMKLTNSTGQTIAETTFNSVDLFDKVMLFNVFIEDISIVSNSQINFQVNGNWTNVITYNVNYDNPYNRAFQNGWNTLAFDRSVYARSSTAGDDGFKNVTGVRFVHTTLTDGIESSVTLDSVFLIDRQATNRPMFTITFDDGYDTDYTKARPVMSKHGFRGVSYINTGSVGGRGRISLEQAHELYAMGWDISNHSHTHKNGFSVPVAELIEDAKLGFEWLVDNGFSKSAVHYSYPNGFNNQELHQALMTHSVTARVNISANYYETFPVANPYKIKAYPILNSSSMVSIKNRIDETIKSGSWLVFMFHGIAEDPAGKSGWITPGKFKEIIDYLALKNADVVTLSDLTL